MIRLWFLDVVDEAQNLPRIVPKHRSTLAIQGFPP